MLCKTDFLEQDKPLRADTAGEEIWTLWYRQAAAEERTGRRDTLWGLKRFLSGSARSRRRRLEANGAVIRDTRPLDSVMELVVATNFHVDKILALRRNLLEALGRH